MKNGNFCDCNRKNAIKFGGFKKKLNICCNVEGNDTALNNSMYCTNPPSEELVGYNTRSAIRSTPSPRNYVRTFVQITRLFSTKYK